MSLVAHWFGSWNNLNKYCKVASSRLSQLVAHPIIFRMFMKEKFDAYVLWALAQRVQNLIVDRSTARNFMVFEIWHAQIDELPRT